METESDQYTQVFLWNTVCAHMYVCILHPVDFLLKMSKFQELLDHLVVRTLCSHCRGMGFDPLLEN